MFSFYLLLVSFISDSFPPAERPIILPAEKDSFIITYRTEERVRTTLFYGKESPYEDTIHETKSKKEHKITLRNLDPDTEYKLLIKVNDSLSPLYRFITPAENKFRVILIPAMKEGDDSEKALLKWLRRPPDLMVSFGKVPKKLLPPLYSYLFPVASIDQEKPSSYRLGDFSFLFLPPDVYADSLFSLLEGRFRPGLDSGDLAIVFLAGGDGFARTYPIMKNPYDSTRPGLVSSGDRDHYSEKEGVIYFILPDYKNPLPLAHREKNCYLAFFGSGEGFVELLKEGKKLQVKTYLFQKKEKEYVVRDSFTIEPEKEEETIKVSKVRVKEVRGYSAEISWETNLPTTSTIEWGQEPQGYTFRYPPPDIEQVFATEHTVYLWGLSPNTKYYYRVGGRKGRKIFWSEERTFITLPPTKDEIVLPVNFAHPVYKSEINFFSVSPFTYQSALGAWNKDLEWTINPKETLLTRASSHSVRNWEIAEWRFPISPGKYYYEIGSFSNPKGEKGKTKIAIEGKVLEKEGGDTIFSGECEVSDGEINLKLGCGDSLIPGYSEISYLLLRLEAKEREKTVFVLSATPNPFSNRTVLKYHLNASRRVIAEVYDISGKRLFTLKNRFENQGYNECVWDGRDLDGRVLPRGVYFISIATENDPGWKVKVSFLGE